jgi:leucyl aminopeptidase
MQIKVQSGDIATASADAVVVNLFEGVASPGGGTGAVDQAMGGAISQLISAGDIRGKLGEFTIIHTLGKVASPRVIVAG